MSRHALMPLLVLATACGKAAPPPAPAPAEQTEYEKNMAAQLEAAMNTPAPDAAPVAAPVVTNNADLDVTLTYADGRTVSGHVQRIERGDDWYAEDGWVDSASKLKLTLDAGGTQTEVPWSEVAQIDIKYADRSDIDCTYDSSFSPWMYMCTLRTDTTVKTKDGKTWTAATRHKWQFTFDDGNTEQFYVYKLPIREQDSKVVDINDTSPENYDLYASLQTKAVTDAKAALVKVTVK